MYLDLILDMKSDQVYKVTEVDLKLAVTNSTVGSWDYAKDKQFPVLRDVKNGKKFIVIGMFAKKTGKSPDESPANCGQILAIDYKANKFTILAERDLLAKVRVDEILLLPKKFEKLMRCKVIPFKKVKLWSSK